jgi:DNA repair protein RadC
MARTRKALFAQTIQGTLQFNQVSEMEIVYRRKSLAAQFPIIRSSEEIYELLKRNWNQDKINLCEQFKVCLLNCRSRPLGICEISTGGISQTVAEPSFIIGLAILSAAKGIILSHNHPSGDSRPSKSDQALTLKVQAGAALFDIKLVDHIIMTDSGYYSFADEGLL